jgi:hypothetical protein
MTPSWNRVRDWWEGEVGELLDCSCWSGSSRLDCSNCGGTLREVMLTQARAARRRKDRS